MLLLDTFNFTSVPYMNAFFTGGYGFLLLQICWIAFPKASASLSPSPLNEKS